MAHLQSPTIIGVGVDRSIVAAQARLRDFEPGTARLRVLERDPDRVVTVDGTPYKGAVRVYAGNQDVWLPMAVCQFIRKGEPEADDLH